MITSEVGIIVVFIYRSAEELCTLLPPHIKENKIPFFLSLQKRESSNFSKII